MHIVSPEGEAKFWLDPIVALAEKSGLSTRQLKELQGVVERKKDEISRAWKNTSKVEVLNVSSHGIWLLVKGKEYFLPYEEFPWFKDARLSEIEHVQLIHGHNLRWEDLDVDLALESLEHPDRYPFKYR